MKISIKGYKSRWGSCNSRGEISFNWRIIMAPKSVINYVVIHELCHLKYHDHSDKFWGFVESNLPSYREQRDWLKCNETLLEW